jgi:hypothetical protein
MNIGQRIQAVSIMLAVCTFPQPSWGEEPIPPISVEAQRKHEKLEQDVNAFVSTAIVQPKSVYHQSLERWNIKVCPQVVGLSKEQGEFVLARLSEIARNARVPLAGETCDPNFRIIVTAQPAPFLSKLGEEMIKADRLARSQVEKFVSMPRPIRVWRSIGLTSIDGSNHIRAHGEDEYFREPSSATLPSQYGSRLNVSLVTRDIESAVVIVDATQVHALNFGQLADYIALIGLAQIDLDKDFSDAPTILDLFKTSAEVKPLGLTEWDKALLHALYNTEQRDTTQMSQIESASLKQIEAATP